MTETIHNTAGCTPADQPTGMVDALLREIADALERLIQRAEVTQIDMRGLPLNDADRTDIEKHLGRGEVSAILTVAGESEVWETRYPGVWWVRHRGASGGVAAEEIVVTRMPEILATHIDDAHDGLARLRDTLKAKAASPLAPSHDIAMTEDAA